MSEKPNGRPVPRPEPIRSVVERWTCPFCPRTATQRLTIARHMPGCWGNPENRTCRTCVHHVLPGAPDQDARCDLGQVLPGDKRPVVDCPLWQWRARKEKK